MRYLLDTHALIWMRDGNPRMNRTKWEPEFFSDANEVHFSHVSLWEISIKRSLGKLSLEGSLADFEKGLRETYGFTLLPLEVSHFTRLESLPYHHSDPFDRLLISQAIEEGAVAVTDDAAWKKYRVKNRW